MKVLHVIPSISPVRGGPSQAIFEMVSALRTEGIEAEIATTNDNGDQAKLNIPLNQKYNYPISKEEWVPIYCFDRYSSSKSFIHEYTVSSGLTSFLWKQIPNYDLVHIHAVFSYPSTVAMMIANFYRIPYIIRPLGSLCAWSLEQSKRQKSVYLHLIKRFLNQSSGLHFTATQEQEEVSQLNLKCNDFVLPLGLNFKDCSQSYPKNIREELKIQNRDPILLFMSRIHPKKGIEALLSALTQIPTPLNLILAGSGDVSYERHIQEFITQNHLEAKVFTIGFVQGELKQQLLSQADLFVLTSYSENFGIVVLESLAAGTPTLITPGVALASMVQEDDLGWVCELNPSAIGQAIQQVLSQPKILQEKGQRAQEQVRANYSWNAIAQRLKRQYQQSLIQGSNNIQSHHSMVKNA